MAPSESGPPSWKESGGPFGGGDAPYAWGDSEPGTPEALAERLALAAFLVIPLLGVAGLLLYILYALGFV